MSKKAFDTEYSGIGCANKAVCQGEATWEIYNTGEYVQFFCSEDQKNQAQSLEKPHEIWTLQ